MTDKDTLALLVREVSDVAEVATVDPDLALQDLGIDSMKLVAALVNYLQLFAETIELEGLAIDEHTTLRNLDAKVRALSAAGAVAPVTLTLATQG